MPQRRKRSGIGFVMSPAAAPAIRKLCKEIPLQSYVYKQQQALHKVRD